MDNKLRGKRSTQQTGVVIDIAYAAVIHTDSAAVVEMAEGYGRLNKLIFHLLRRRLQAPPGVEERKRSRCNKLVLLLYLTLAHFCIIERCDLPMPKYRGLVVDGKPYIL